MTAIQLLDMACIFERQRAERRRAPFSGCWEWFRGHGGTYPPDYEVFLRFVKEETLDTARRNIESEYAGALQEHSDRIEEQS